MTLHKWGKFKREPQYSYVDRAEVSDWNYTSITSEEILREQREVYDSWRVVNGQVVMGKRLKEWYDFQGVTTCYAFIPPNYLTKYENGYSEKLQTWGWLAYDGYVRIWKDKKLDGYKKGSRLDTVTSSNRNAYPNDGASGSYWYVYEGIANQEPTISGQDEDWGGYKQAFKRYYSVDDGDSGQQLNVTVSLNGVTIATVNNATRKTDYPIDIDDSKFNALTLNEQNTIEITVTDSSGATAVRRYTFKRINTAPVVTMTNAHYGEQNKPFTINFEAADPDGDEITAKLFIDDVQIKDLGTIKGKQSVTIPKIDFAKIPNGEHKIRVEAKDSYNAVGAGYADFSKNLTYAWYRLKKELSEQPSAVIVNPLVELAPGAKMTIKVCSNVKDAQPTWETVPEELYGQKYNFRNTSKTGDKWGVGVEIRIDKEKATEESYLYGFVGAYM